MDSRGTKNSNTIPYWLKGDRVRGVGNSPLHFFPQLREMVYMRMGMEEVYSPNSVCKPLLGNPVNVTWVWHMYVRITHLSSCWYIFSPIYSFNSSAAEGSNWGAVPEQHTGRRADPRLGAAAGGGGGSGNGWTGADPLCSAHPPTL